MREPDEQSDRYRALYEDAPCGLLSTTATGQILRVNQTLCRWLGYTPDELVQIKRLPELLTVGCRIFHQTHWMPLLQMQGSVAEVQLEMVGRDRRVHPVLVNAVRHQHDDGTHHDELAIFIAVDRRKYERELLGARARADQLLSSERAAQDELTKVLQESQQEAQQRAVLAEQLIGIVSHDLRTPLNAILLGASLLVASTVTQAQNRTIQRIISASNRANRLIADLLDFTQARLGGGLRVTVAPLDLHVLVAEGLEELRLASPTRLLEHRRSGDGSCVADADRLSQVVSNLVSNALTYGTPDRPIVITTQVNTETLRIEVHNFGTPIPPELLPHLFEPLRRGEQQLKQGSRSVGLGLYIVQQIAHAHGGTVRVSSQREEGTRFVVELPATP